MPVLTSLYGKQLHPLIDANEIIENLYVGSEPQFDAMELPVHTLVLCAKEIQPIRKHIAFEGTVIRARLNDADPIPYDQINSALQAATMVADQISCNRKVLVTCAAGWNRSALVAGLALRKLKPDVRPLDIVILIRHQRHENALCNPFFVKLIETLSV